MGSVRKLMSVNSRLWLILLLLLLQTCVTYRAKHAKFHRLFLASKLEEADGVLAQDKRAPQSKNRLLYHFNRGLVAHLRGQYEESNYFFEQAYLTYENLLTKPVDEALVFLINPTVTDYKGEAHEVPLLHYYKALNFLQLGQYDAALVECRRLNIKLNQLSDKYSSIDAYRRDAFMHTFMGLVYQANHDYNNAFIAYRNAVEVYQEDYQHLFGLKVPEQLKRDLIYTAYKTGLYEQVAQYRQLFKLSYDPAKEAVSSDVVLFWNNGLGPVKDEWSINFVLVKGPNGVIFFKNEALGLVFPFPLSDDGEEEELLSKLQFVRVAFPAYKERPLMYDQAVVTTDQSGQQRLELLEDINAISFRVLKQRMVAELSKALLRVALKQASAYQVRKQNALLGAVLGGVNFLTEKADTRNWQTLPHSIYYTRVCLPEGTHAIHFNASSRQYPWARQHQEIVLKLQQGQTAFQVVNAPYVAPH